MTDVAWPSDIIPYGVSFYLQPYTGGTQSPFTRQTKIYTLSKPRWICSLRFRALETADKWKGTPRADWGERIDAFLADLDGRANRVSLYDFRRPGKGRPFVNAAATAGTNTITLTGAKVGDIRVGEYIGGDGRPHIITELQVSGSNLIATVKPYWESNIALGAATYQKVTGFFRTTTDDAGQNFAGLAEATEYQLDFEEDWGPSVDVTYSGNVVTYP